MTDAELRKEIAEDGSIVISIHLFLRALDRIAALRIGIDAIRCDPDTTNGGFAARLLAADDAAQES